MPAEFPPKKKKTVSPWKADEGLGDFEAEEPDEKGSFIATFAKVAVFAAVLAAAGFGYYYFLSKPSGVNVAVEFSKPDKIFAGQPFSVTVSFSNYSEQVLKNARLSVYLPEKVSYLSGVAGQRIIEKEIGDVGPGSVNPNTFDFIATGDSQTLAHINAKISYGLVGSTANFESQSGADLPIGQQAVDLSFEQPESVFGGSNFDLVVKYQNNSDRDIRKAVLKMDYPKEFVFSKSSLKNSSGNSQWALGDLPKGSGGSLTITGSLAGAGQALSDFRGTISAAFGGQTFAVAEQTASVSLSISPLSVSASVNGSSGYVARVGDQLTYTIHYKNDSADAFQSITVKATISGEMFDFSTLNTDAAYDPVKNTLTWMAANAPALAQLSPGGEGNLTVNVKLKKDFPIRRISDKNYVLKLQLEISSPTVPAGTRAPQTVSMSSLETKVAGKIAVQAKGLWRDAASGILNKGPYPPKVNQTTQYTVHWLVTNYSTDVSNIRVSAFLQSGARWTGVVKSNTDSQPSYDSASGKITWDIGDMIATKGVISKPLEAIFQVELTPAINQLNQSVTFLGNTIVEGDDNFTGAQLSGSHPALTTALPDDATISAALDRTVKQ